MARDIYKEVTDSICAEFSIDGFIPWRDNKNRFASIRKTGRPARLTSRIISNSFEDNLRAIFTGVEGAGRGRFLAPADPDGIDGIVDPRNRTDFNTGGSHA